MRKTEMVCKYCGKKIYNTVKAGGVFVSCDLGMVYFNEADQKTLFLGTDGKIHKGAECRKNANGAMLGRKLHGERRVPESAYFWRKTK